MVISDVVTSSVTFVCGSGILGIFGNEPALFSTASFTSGLLIFLGTFWMSSAYAKESLNSWSSKSLLITPAFSNTPIV